MRILSGVEDGLTLGTPIGMEVTLYIIRCPKFYVFVISVTLNLRYSMKINAAMIMKTLKSSLVLHMQI